MLVFRSAGSEVGVGYAVRAIWLSLIELQRPEIVEMHDPLDLAIGGNNDQRGNLLLFHKR